MHWEQLRAEFQRLMLFHPAPAMVVIHLGGNDLVTWSQSKLLKKIKTDLRYMASVFPDAQVIWSDILPRQAWRGVESSVESLRKLDQKRKRINRIGRQVTLSLNGKGISHELDFATPGIFRPDSVHLTRIGNAIFLNTFEEALNIFFRNPSVSVFNANS